MPSRLPARALAAPALLALSALPPVSLSAQSAPADFVLDALGRHPIVFVGDVHPLAEPKRVIAEVIARQDPARPLDLLALEVASEQQPFIDAYLASQPEDTTILLANPRTLRAHWGASAEYLAIYRAAWRWNRDHPGRPLRVLAADIRGWPIAPLTANMAAGGFANRDEWMARQFRQAVREHPEWRVLIFMGGYHGLRRGGGEVTVGSARARFDRWFSGWLEEAGVRVYSILSDAPQGDGHGATRVFDAIAAERGPVNLALPLGEGTDSIARPMHDVQLEGYRLAFWPDRFPLRSAIDAMLVFNRPTPITVLEGFGLSAP